MYGNLTNNRARRREILLFLNLGTRLLCTVCVCARVCVCVGLLYQEGVWKINSEFMRGVFDFSFCTALLITLGWCNSNGMIMKWTSLYLHLDMMGAHTNTGRICKCIFYSVWVNYQTVSVETTDMLSVLLVHICRRLTPHWKSGIQKLKPGNKIKVLGYWMI